MAMTVSTIAVSALLLAAPARLELLPPAEGFVAGREDVLSIAALDSAGTLTIASGTPAVRGVAAGAAERIADGVWQVKVTPAAAGEIAIGATLGGASGERKAKVEPAVALALSLADRELLPGQRGTVLAVVDVRSASGEPVDGLAPKIAVSAGSAGAPKRIGPGKWSAALKMPPERYPRAVLVAATAPGRRDVAPVAAVIALRGKATIPITSEPKAKITVRVGKRSFGPFTADAHGSVEVAIEAGPSDTTMEVESLDSAGNRGVKTVALDMPRWNRLLAAASAEPHGLDGRTRVTVYAALIDRRGALEDAKPRASAGGTSIPLEGKNGVFSGSAVLSLPAGEESVTVSAGDAKEKVDIEVKPAPAVGIAIELVPDAPLKMDGAAVTVRAWRLDAQRRRVAGAVPAISTSEGLRLTPLPPGADTASARLKALEGKIAPNTWVGAKAPGPGFTLGVQRAVTVSAGEPAKVEVLSVVPPRLPADGASVAEIEARVTDKWGNPVRGHKITTNATAGDVVSSNEPEPGLYRIVLRAPRQPGSGSIGVVAGPARADTDITFVRPPSRIAVAAGAGGTSNLGALSSGIAWLEARRSLGAGESPWAALVRVHGARGTFGVKSAVGKYDVTVGQTLALAGIRRRFTQPFSGWTIAAALAAGGGLVQVDEKNAVGTVSESGTAFGGRVALTAERALMQRGGLVLEAGYGYVVADDALIQGNLGGAEVTVGYRHGF